jgi:hypothetical protein
LANLPALPISAFRMSVRLKDEYQIWRITIFSDPLARH